MAFYDLPRSEELLGVVGAQLDDEGPVEGTGFFAEGEVEVGRAVGGVLEGQEEREGV
jgi:hypothetical protein